MPLKVRRRRVIVAGAIAALALSSGCNKSPTNPDSPVVLNSLAVTGPAQIALGETATFTAIATYSDGSTRDVTPHATWISQSFAVTFTSPGVALGTGQYETTIMVRYQEAWGTNQTRQASTTTTLLVLERGTFKVSGRVAAVGNGPVNGVLVHVVSGNLAEKVSGLNNGRYAFYGAVGPMQIEVTSNGNLTERHDLVITSNTVDDFFLTPLVGSEDVSGAWTLTLADASSSCPAGFPAALRGRSYSLGVTQQGSKLTLSLGRPGLIVEFPEFFYGSVTANSVLLDLQFLFDDFTGARILNIIDRLNATDTLAFGITIMGTHSGSEIVGPAAGTILYWTGPITGTPAWQCTAQDHVFTVRR